MAFRGQKLKPTPLQRFKTTLQTTTKLGLPLKWNLNNWLDQPIAN